MQAVSALTHSRNRREIQRILSVLGYEMTVCKTFMELENLLKAAPALVICNAEFQEHSVIDLPAKYPKIHWIIQGEFSWSAAAELVRVHGFCDVILEPFSCSNLFDAVWLLDNGGCAYSTGQVAYMRWLHGTIVKAGPSNSEKYLEKLDEPGKNADAEFSPLSSLKQCFFRKTDSGLLSKTHFASLLYRIMNEQLSGTLHGFRESLHWRIAFDAGAPYAFSTCDAYSFFELKTWTEQVPEFHNLWMHDGRDENLLEVYSRQPELIEAYKAWMTSSISEMFTWPEAEFSWHGWEISPKKAFHPEFSLQECMEMILDGVFHHLPLSFVVEVTQSCLPYFLKLNDNRQRFLEQLAPETATVVEKLKKGDTLTNLLMSENDKITVHQTVYLLLIMSQLDFIA